MLLFTALASAAPNGSVALSEQVSALGETVHHLEATHCTADLHTEYAKLEALEPAQVSRPDLAQHGQGLAERLFETRQALQRKLVSFHHEGTLTGSCVVSARRIDLGMRYLTDHLYMEGLETAPWQTAPGFAGAQDLRSGDILVTRGNGLSSSGIAHIGRIDSQFSHNAMVYIDPQGEAWTIEAYLEKGAQVQPLRDFLAHDLGRVVAIRYDGDATLSARAASMAYTRIADGPAIDYDEAFDSDNSEELFCSEIGPWAFEMAGGPTNFPLHRTVFPRDQNGKMFDAMGIEGAGLAAPVDLLFDPRFEILGEWRSVNDLEQMRRQDAVVESVFTWMEEDGYELSPVWANRALVDVGLTVRRIPWVGGVLKERIHPHGDRQFLVAGLALQQAGEALYDDLNDRLEHQGNALSWTQLKTEIEALRDEDRAVWEQRPRQAGMHRVLHPKGS